MNFEVKTRASYKSELTFLIIMTLIFGFCCLILGYLALPVAAGFYAALLSVEKKENRFFSYIVPLIPLVANVFINGFYSLEAITYVAVGATIFYGYDRRKNKAVFSFIASVVVVAFIILSLLFLAFDKLGTLKGSAPLDFYHEFYEVGKLKFVDILTSFTSEDSEKVIFYNFNAFEAVDMYNTFVIFCIPLMAILAFVTVGISSKILSSLMRKYDVSDKRLVDWNFITTPFLAYSYIVISVLSGLSSEGVVGLSLSFVSSILMAVYFYIGISATYSFICAKKSTRFAILVIFAALVAFSSFIPQLISFIGVFVNNTIYKSKNSKSSDAS